MEIRKGEIPTSSVVYGFIGRDPEKKETLEKIPTDEERLVFESGRIPDGWLGLPEMYC